MKNRLTAVCICLLLLVSLVIPKAGAIKLQSIVHPATWATMFIFGNHLFIHHFLLHIYLKSELPPLSYTLQQKIDPNERVLMPRVRRSNNLVLSGQQEDLASTICLPVYDVEEMQEYKSQIVSLCRQWFKEHKMVFPHQVLNVPVNSLNYLLLPRLIYSIAENTLSLKVTLVSYVNSQGEVDDKPILDHRARWYKRHWLEPKIPTDRTRDQTEIFSDRSQAKQHYPIELISTAAGTTPNKEFRFSIPSLSYLRNDEKEFYIVVKNTSDGFFWVINENWPDDLNSMNLSLSPRR